MTVAAAAGYFVFITDVFNSSEQSITPERIKPKIEHLITKKNPLINSVYSGSREKFIRFRCSTRRESGNKTERPLQTGFRLLGILTDTMTFYGFFRRTLLVETN